MPSESPEAARSSLVSTQSHVPFLLPAVSTCPGQFPTLKWKPVLSSGPARELKNSTNRSSLVPMIEYGNFPMPQKVPALFHGGEKFCLSDKSTNHQSSNLHVSSYNAKYKSALRSQTFISNSFWLHGNLTKCKGE